MVTELVKISVLEATTDEQLISKADIFINDFQKKQDGFIDVDLVKDIKENEWCFVFHYENMEKVNAIGEKMRTSKEFDDFKTLVVPGSIRLAFYNTFKKWL